MLIGALSIAGHVGLLAAVLTVHPDPPRAVEPEPMIVQLVEAPRPPEIAPALAPNPSEPTPPAKPPPRRNIARRAPAPPHIEPLPAGEGPSDDGVELSEGQVASAARAGSGGGARECDMLGWLQAALRKDHRVQAAVAEAHGGSAGKALFVWNGDWVRSRGQDGAGLAAVREAIMWEVAFAPKPCRAQPVHGLVLISLNDGPGAPRVVVGSDVWRWSDLLIPRNGVMRP